MSSMQDSRVLPAARKSEWALSSVRPVTLLIASGIILVAAILIVTGIVAGHLRQQALMTTEATLAQLDAVVAEAGGRSMRVIDRALGDVAGHLRPAEAAGSDDAARALAGPQVAALLNGKIEALPQITGIAIAGADGRLINQAGAWPIEEASLAGRDYFAALRADPALDLFVGAPAPGIAPAIAFARKLRDARGAFVGVVVASVPVSEFDSFYRNIPLGADGMVSLVRQDGTLLAQYPGQPAALGRSLDNQRLKAMLAESSQGAIDDDNAHTGEWRIYALHALSGYPAAVVISRRGDQALVDWSRQAIFFAGFAVIGALATAMMVYLIARQFRAYSTLAAVRAEKIEVEHARVVAEAELLKKERLSVLGQLTATVAHELRNPLSAIRNTLFTMKEIATSGGVKLDRPIARMERSIERCDRIIGDLLEYTRHRELRREQTDFDHWLGEVLAEHALPPAIKLDVELQTRDAKLPIDGDRIRRVIVNLIDNAAQALAEMPPGSDQRIIVRTVLADDMLEFDIADTGPGIPPENLARIFQPLFSTKSFGTGLGLPTVKQIVVQHGGTINVQSEVGQGTCVTVRLPLEPVLEAAA
jgi:signal transduction histidine kinase